ncbi:hypothetical protein [Larkinella harenae]
MLRILSFALRRRFTGYVKNTESVWGLIGRIVYLLLVLLYAAGTGWLIDVLDTIDGLSFDSGTFIAGMNGALCALCVVVEFFPSYKQRSGLVSAVFPVRFMDRWAVNVLYDSLTFTFTGAWLAFFIINALSTRYAVTQLITSLLMLTSTAIFVQSLKAFIEQSHRRQVWSMIGWAILNATMVWAIVQFYAQERVLIAVLFIGLVSQIGLLIQLDRTVAEPSGATFIFNRKIAILSSLSPVYKVFMSNAKARNAFAFGLLIKVVFLFFQGSLFAGNVFTAEYIQKLYVSPLILFTYVANNLWGFFPTVWVNSAMGKPTAAYRLYLQILILPLLLDLFITLGVTVYTQLIGPNLILFYMLCTILLCLNGMIFSFYKAFEVHNSLNFGQMKNDNVNGWSICASIGLMILTIFASKTLLTEVLLGVSIGWSIWYFVYRSVPKNATSTRYRLYHSLFVKDE